MAPMHSQFVFDRRKIIIIIIPTKNKRQKTIFSFYLLCYSLLRSEWWTISNSIILLFIVNSIYLCQSARNNIVCSVCVCAPFFRPMYCVATALQGGSNWKKRATTKSIQSVDFLSSCICERVRSVTFYLFSLFVCFFFLSLYQENSSCHIFKGGEKNKTKKKSYTRCNRCDVLLWPIWCMLLPFAQRQPFYAILRMQSFMIERKAICVHTWYECRAGEIVVEMLGDGFEHIYQQLCPLILHFAKFVHCFWG